MQTSTRRARCAVGALLLCFLLAAAPSWAEDAAPLTLAEATILALLAHPDVQRAEAAVAAARGGRSGAGAPTNNPSLGFEVGPRLGGERIEVDLGVGLSVPFDLGGAPRAQRSEASAELRAAEAELLGARLAVRALVRRAFAEASAGEQGVTLAQDALVVARETERVAQRRHELGEAAVLEPNAAALARVRAQMEVARAEGARTRAQTELRRSLAWDGSVAVVLAPILADPQPRLPLDTEALLVLAAQRRPELAAAKAHREATQAGLAAARGVGAPGLSLDAGWTREGSEADVITGGLTFELPVQRNQRGVAAARGAASAATIDEEQARVEVSREVVQALALWVQAVERRRLVADEALPIAVENLRLLQRAYEAGQADLVAVLLMQAQAVETRATFIETTVELHQAAAALELATGEALFP